MEFLEQQGQARPYRATFQPSQQPITLPQLGVDQTLQLTFDLTDRQLHLIHEHRTTGGLLLDIYLSGYAIQDGHYVAVGESQISHQIGQSDWLLLEQAGYRRFLLLELEAPDLRSHPVQAEAMEYFIRAQRHYLNGEWRLTVESLRQSLSCLVGKKAEDEEHEIDVSEALRTARKAVREGQLGYGPRLELVHEAAKFLCVLGAHPEVAETRRPTPTVLSSSLAVSCRPPARGEVNSKSQMAGRPHDNRR